MEDIQIENTPTPIKRPYQPTPSTNSSIKKKIMCRFFIMGNCTKGDNCCYLHSETEKTKMISKPTIECPMYNLGCCKNGPMCKYKHIKKEPKAFDSPSEYPEIPIWYLEHYFDKPLSLLLDDFERHNSTEVQELKDKYGVNKKKQYSNYQYDIYADKKDSIIYQLDQKVKYFLLKCAKFSTIKFSMEHNMIMAPSECVEIYQEEKNKGENVVLIIFDMENRNYSGFVFFKKKIDSNEEFIESLRYRDNHSMIQPEELKNGFDYIKIEWLWRTKLHYTKLSHMINPLNDNVLDDLNLSQDIGFYACRMMIKRLSKEEVRELVKQKQAHDEEDSNSYSKEEEGQNGYNQVSTLPNISMNNYQHYKQQQQQQQLHSFQNVTHSQYSDKKVYVTNINNLQVSINHNTMPYYEKSTYSKKKRSRSKSNSNSKYQSKKDYDDYYDQNQHCHHRNHYNHYKSNYDTYDNGRYNNNNRRNHDSSSHRKYHDNDSYDDYDHYKPKITYHKDKDNNRTTKIYLQKEHDKSNHHSYNNKLFSNAMKKITPNLNNGK